MGLKNYKPYTKSSRGTILIDRAGLWKGKPYKPLTSVNNASKGRNNLGRITSRNHGGGHKQKYRDVDFYRRKTDMKAEVERIEYDPNRSAYIMLVKFEDGKRFYYLAPQKINVGDTIENGTIMLFDVDVKGATNLIEEFFEDIVSIFIEPPGINDQDKKESLSERMQKRGNTNETLIKQRLKRFDLELSFKEKFNFSFINEDLKETIKEIEKVIKENI